MSDAAHEKETSVPQATHVHGLTGTQDVERIEAPVTWKAYLICAFASFGGIFFGYDSGYINGVLGSRIFIDAVEYPGAEAVSESHTSLIVSILSCGTFFGAVIAGDVADFIGRKWTVIMGCFIYMAGVVIQMITGAGDPLAAIVTGRLIAGLGVGFESAIVILYMSEIVSPPSCSSLLVISLLTSFPVPPQSSWRPGCRLPILHHHWYHACCLCGLRYRGPSRHWRIPHSHRHPIHLGYHSRRRSLLPARFSSLLRQAWQHCRGHRCPLPPPWPAPIFRVYPGRAC